jgi:hypothetical protein
MSLNIYIYIKNVATCFGRTGLSSGNSVASQSASGPYLTSDLHLSSNLVPTFADRGCHVLRVVNFHGRNLDFLDRSRYYLFHVAPQLTSRGWVNPVLNPLLLRKSGSAGNRTRDPCIWQPETLTTRQHERSSSGNTLLKLKLSRF